MALQMLVLLADLAALDILMYLSRHAMPLVHPVHVVNCSVVAHVARVVGIMQFLQDGVLLAPLVHHPGNRSLDISQAVLCCLQNQTRDQRSTLE